MTNRNNMETTMAHAQILLHARLETGLLDQFPTPLPETLEQAYDIQDAVIDGWPGEIGGWKVGRILGAAVSKYNCDRLAGPIFSDMIAQTRTNSLEVPVYPEGFAAIEGECVAVINKDAPIDKTTYSTQEAVDMIDSIHLGVEIASSPFPGINDNGPLVTICDLGNNYGLIVGEAIPNWRELRLQDWTMATFIGDERVGQSTPADIPGGPVESVRFMLENSARRGRPLKKGALVSTGAVTGVHAIKVGQTARVELVGASQINCTIVARQPR